MKVLFLTIGSFWNINDHGIYPDLLREFIRHGHEVYVVCASEKRTGMPTAYMEGDSAHILRVRTGNITQTNMVEKGISTILIKQQFLSAIKKYYKGIRFDLVLYPTPPITLCGVVEYIKKRDGAKTYLLLKDIFPQNAVDMGMMSTSGLQSIIYYYFRNKEKELYKVSDRIGCMSVANVEYVLSHNSEVDPDKVEVCPNSIEVIDRSLNVKRRRELRDEYGIPQNKKVFLYGGNFGRPQGIPFLIECIKKAQDIADVFFLLVGGGTEYGKLEAFVLRDKPDNVKLLGFLSNEAYDGLAGACDVGLIFLDHHFTIPNFPSRLLGYMQAKLPVLACTDPNTDIGRVITDNGFGWWCESDSSDSFRAKVSEIVNSQTSRLGETGYQYLLRHYSVSSGYEMIIRSTAGGKA